jgi:hypothetical protein
MSHRRSVAFLTASLVALPLLVATATAGSAGSSDDPIPAVAHPSSVDDFTHPTRIDNAYFPLKPGTQWVYEGSVTEEGETVPHRVVFTVSSLTKEIDGVRTRVIWDRDYADGTLEEAELAFFAQADDGDLWRFGEYPEEYADGVFEGAPNLWITGMARARAGLYMLDDPEVGDSYEQGLVRPIEFWDVAEVRAEDLRNCVPVGCYHDVVRIHETSPFDPAGGTQTKFYAPRVGLIRIGAIGGDAQEVMTLRRMKVLSDDQLEWVDAEVRKMDRHGREVSDLYARTEPVG